MNQEPLIPLINNAALLIAMVVVYEALSTRIRERKKIWWQVISGLILGGIGMAVMLNPWVLAPGVIFDTRSVILGLSGLFFGTIPTLLAVLITGALRLWMGGSGALMGIAVIASSGGIGLLWRHLRRRGLRILPFWELYLFSLLIHIVMLLCSLLLPPEVRFRFFSEAALPVMLIYPLATALAGWAMAIREQRRHLESEKEKAEETLRLNEARLRSLVEILQSETRDLKNFLASALEKVIELTGSKVGFIGTYNEDKKRLEVNLFSKSALEECGIPNPLSAFDLETGGLWAEAIRQRKPLIINDYQAPNPLKKGYPEGHIELHQLLAVPVFRNGEIVGLVALANKDNDYQEMDAIQTGLLMETVWRTVERKRAEEALVEEKERAQKCLEVAGVMFVVLNTKGEVTLINQKGCEILGYPQQEIVGKNWFDHFLPSPVGNQVKEVFQKLVSGEIESFEYYENPVLTRDGEERIVAWHNILLRDETGNIIGTLSSGEDITERRRAEEELKERETKLNLALEAAGMGVWERDLALNRYAFTEEAFKLLGIDPQKFMGTVEEFLSVVHPEDRERLRAFMANVGQLDQPFDQEYRVLWPDGTVRVVRARGKVMRKENGAPTRVIGVLWDVTEWREKQKEVERARADFLLSVSHELKTPLFLMEANLELLKSYPPEERLKQFFSLEEIFSRNLLRLRYLVDNLIDSQRTATMGTHLSLKKTDLNFLITSALEELEIIEKRHNIQIRLDLKSLPELDLDQEAITRVFHNLLTNAIKFSPPGEVVEVRTRGEEGQVILEVQDHGPGIPQEEIPYLFQPFSRTKQAVQSVIPGAGLGLYVSKILIEAHGGTIALQSGEGKGTTVTVRLPVKDEGCRE